MPEEPLLKFTSPITYVAERLKDIESICGDPRISPEEKIKQISAHTASMREQFEPVLDALNTERLT